MKIPSEKDIINEVESLKAFLITFNSKWETEENKKFVFNKLNKIIRMLNQPCRRVDFKPTHPAPENKEEGKKNG